MNPSSRTGKPVSLRLVLPNKSNILPPDLAALLALDPILHHRLGLDQIGVKQNPGRAQGLGQEGGRGAEEGFAADKVGILGDDDSGDGVQLLRQAMMSYEREGGRERGGGASEVGSAEVGRRRSSVRSDHSERYGGNFFSHQDRACAHNARAEEGECKEATMCQWSFRGCSTYQQRNRTDLKVEYMV